MISPNYSPNLKLVYGSNEKAQTKPSDEVFVSGYDRFIAESDLEDVELFFREIAKRFYWMGFQEGQATKTS